MMRVTVTGATGLIGTRAVAALQDRGDEVTVLSRRPEHAHRLFLMAAGSCPYFLTSKAADFPDVDRLALGEAVAGEWIDGRILVK
jgi:uncharacterized protein YbjT (DUF2867 family)